MRAISFQTKCLVHICNGNAASLWDPRRSAKGSGRFGCFGPIGPHPTWQQDQNDASSHYAVHAHRDWETWQMNCLHRAPLAWNEDQYVKSFFTSDLCCYSGIRSINYNIIHRSITEISIFNGPLGPRLVHHYPWHSFAKHQGNLLPVLHMFHQRAARLLYCHMNTSADANDCNESKSGHYPEWQLQWWYVLIICILYIIDDWLNLANTDHLIIIS